MIVSCFVNINQLIICICW